MSAARQDDLRPADERMPGQVVVAAFDFDGTLTRGGSVWRFLTAMCGRDAVISAGIALFPKLLRAALFGGEAADRAKEALFVRTLAGRSETEISERAAVFGVAHYRRRNRAKVRARLDWHRRQGHHVVVVSASPECYVRAAATELHAEGVVATELEIGGNGKLTGRFRAGNCRGPQKLARLEEWMGTSLGATHDGDGAPPYVWAYGNSAGDLEMLLAADIGVDAGRLGRFGKLRRFRRLGDVLTAW
ncbi:MAG TPA: HAD-IB family hydrolase [Acidimicrobiales bacterium]|nr:HAD-IB family hydrolase [Acidimicrobiales bacterium]